MHEACFRVDVRAQAAVQLPFGAAGLCPMVVCVEERIRFFGFVRIVEHRFATLFELELGFIKASVREFSGSVIDIIALVVRCGVLRLWRRRKVRQSVDDIVLHLAISHDPGRGTNGSSGP